MTRSSRFRPSASAAAWRWETQLIMQSPTRTSTAAAPSRAAWRAGHWRRRRARVAGRWWAASQLAQGQICRFAHALVRVFKAQTRNRGPSLAACGPRPAPPPGARSRRIAQRAGQRLDGEVVLHAPSAKANGLAYAGVLVLQRDDEVLDPVCVRGVAQFLDDA